MIDSTTVNIAQKNFLTKHRWSDILVHIQVTILFFGNFLLIIYSYYTTENYIKLY